MMMTTIIFAQRHANVRKGMHNSAEELKTELSLNDAQYAKVNDLNQKFTSQMQALRSDSSKARDTRREEMKNINVERKSEMKKILTEKQYTQWTALQERRKDEAMQNKPNGTQADRMKKDLLLTDDQYVKIKTIDQNFGVRFKTLRDDSVSERKSVRADMKNLKMQRDAEIKQVLTPDQYTKWTAQKAEKKNQKKIKKHSRE